MLCTSALASPVLGNACISTEMPSQAETSIGKNRSSTEEPASLSRIQSNTPNSLSWIEPAAESAPPPAC